MWKYVSGLRETLQRSVNYFDARCGAGLASNQQNSIVPRKESPIKEYEETRKCAKYFDIRSKRRNGCKWRRCHILHTWKNAVTWSGAIVVGWYASQLLYLNHKRKILIENSDIKKICLKKLICSNTKSIHSAVLSRIVFAQPNDSGPINIPQNVVNILHSVNCNAHKNETSKESDSFESSLDEAVKGLTNVLSSVENRLGLAAIEGGDLKYGIEMLQSAAQKNNAPALYNLALCYQKGIGVRKDDKMAAELYQAAVMLEHPGAMYNLAIFHGQGRGGLKRNPKVAEELLHMAASKGQEDAIKALPHIDPPQKLKNINIDGTVMSNSIQDSIDKDPYTPMHSFLETLLGYFIQGFPISSDPPFTEKLVWHLQLMTHRTKQRPSI